MAKNNNKPVEETVAASPEAADAPAPEAPHAVVEVAAPTKILIRAVHGTMIHPFTPMDIRQDAITEVGEIDSWLQSQIDEKKIVIVG